MSEIDFKTAAARIHDGLQLDFMTVCEREAKKLAPLVESEIELMLLATFGMVSRLSDLKLEIGDEFKDGDPEGWVHLLITPQFKWSGYRIDFCFRASNAPDTMLFVECDGHDFHERTKEQAERDRSKDRAIQAAGISILRFTGREIWRDPATVAAEIINFMSGYGRR